MAKLKKTHKASKKAADVMLKVCAVSTVVLVVVTAMICTSASKVNESPEPYFPPEPVTEPLIPDITEPETELPETVYETDPAPDTEPETDQQSGEYETETDPQTDVTVPETTNAPATKAPETKAPVTDPPVTKAPEETSGKQQYTEYNGRVFGENETFVGEYKSDGVSIGVSNVKKGDLSYYICDIKLSDVTKLHTAFAGGKITGRAYTSKIAASVGAGFAINGDFCGFRSNGIIIREGGLYRNKKAGWDLCYINQYGDMIVTKNDSCDGKALANDRVWQSWCFGPTLVKDYEAIPKDKLNTPDLSRSAREPRTAIGQVDTLHYIFLIVDATRVRNGVGWTTVGGMSFTELAETFVSLGCKVAYNLDGGGSTTMYLNGKIANKPCMEGERQVSDIIYFK